MPELPEVETVRLQLKRKVSGKKIASVEVRHRKTVDHNSKFESILKGKTISDIERVGKLMMFNFTEDENIHLLAHLKMTGQFFFVDTKGKVDGGGHSFTNKDLELPHKHTRVIFNFTDKSTLYFNDMRLFGYAKLANTKTVEAERLKYGPEPIDANFDIEWFVSELRKKKSLVKAALLKQSFVAGLGNIYVDEALWRAKVKPMRRADTLTKAEAAAIAAASGDVMRESIKVGGTTFQHFADTDGESGNFKEYLKVFGKQGTKCERCGGIIKKVRTAGRGTHYCPKCQR